MTSPATSFTSAFDRVIEALLAVGSRQGPSGDWNCPAHDDRTPSLSVNQAADGRVLLHCHAGCSFDAVLAVLGKSKRELFGEPRPSMNGHSALSTPPRVVATYNYTDERGELLYQVERLEPKSFRQRRPDGREGWIWSLGDVRRVLYHLPEVIAAVAADTIFVVEGEKDADALRADDQVATCNAGGAGKWRDEYTEVLRGAEVVIVRDRDEAGHSHARKVAEALDGIAKSVRIVEAKTGKDAADHLAVGLGVEDFVQVWPEPEAQSLRTEPFSGDSLLELLKRDARAAIHAGVPTPGALTLLVAPAFNGKSSLAYWNALARAAGVAPWEGAPAPEAGAVLFISPDESAEQIARRMAGLSQHHPAGPLERYADRIHVLAPDPALDVTALDALRLDAAGLAHLAERLEQAVAAGHPFAEVYIDAYADVLPLHEDENSNGAATRIGGGLQALAVRFGCAITLLHHAGKPPKDSKHEGADLRYLGRGASALAAKARVVMTLEAMAEMPHARLVRVETNLGSRPTPLLLQVSVEDSEGALDYFRAIEPPKAEVLHPRDVMPDGEPISTSELARRLEDHKGMRGGVAKNNATRLRTQWLKLKLITVEDGPRGAKMIHLREADDA